MTAHWPLVVKFSTTGVDAEPSVQPAVLPVEATAYEIAPSEFVTGAPVSVVPDCAVVRTVGDGDHNSVGIDSALTVNVSCVAAAEYDDVAAAVAPIVHTPAPT